MSMSPLAGDSLQKRLNLSSRLKRLLVPLFAATALLAIVEAPAAQAGQQAICAQSVTIRSSPSWSGAAIGTVNQGIGWVHNNYVNTHWSYGWTYFYLYGNPNLFGQWWGYIPTQYFC